MTEAEWLASDDPAAMLAWLTEPAELRAGPPRRPSDRKLRLFCVACARMLPLGPDQDVRENELAFIRLAEAAAEDGRGVKETPGRKRICVGLGLNDDEADEIARYWAEDREDMNRLAPLAVRAALMRDIVGNPWRRWLVAEWAMNPEAFGFTDVFDTRWLTPLVVSLATAAYEERLPDGTLYPARLAVLSDSLEDAGCADEAILRHLRGEEPCRKCGGQGFIRTPGDRYARTMNCSEVATAEYPIGVGCAGTGWDEMRGPHVRGCWALDLILGKS